MKKLERFCNIVIAITSVVALISIIALLSIYDFESTPLRVVALRYLMAVVIFMVTGIVIGLMFLIIGKVERYELERPHEKTLEEIQQRSCKAVFCNYDSKGKYLYERSESDAKIS